MEVSPLSTPAMVTSTAALEGGCSSCFGGVSSASRLWCRWLKVRSWSTCRCPRSSSLKKKRRTLPVGVLGIFVFVLGFGFLDLLDLDLAMRDLWAIWVWIRLEAMVVYGQERRNVSLSVEEYRFRLLAGRGSGPACQPSARIFENLRQKCNAYKLQSHLSF